MTAIEDMDTNAMTQERNILSKMGDMRFTDTGVAKNIKPHPVINKTIKQNIYGVTKGETGTKTRPFIQVQDVSTDDTWR